LVWHQVCNLTLLRNHNSVLFSSWLITVFVTWVTPKVRLVEQELLTLSYIFLTNIVNWNTRYITRQVPLVEQEPLILPEHMSSPPVFSGVRATRCLVLYVYFVDRCLSWCTFSFGRSFLTQIFHNGQPKFRSDDFNMTERNPWFNSFLVSSNPLSRKSCWEPQALEYRINWEIYTPLSDGDTQNYCVIQIALLLTDIYHTLWKKQDLMFSIFHFLIVIY
jgi:hypothetical protein